MLVSVNIPFAQLCNGEHVGREVKPRDEGIGPMCGHVARRDAAGAADVERLAHLPRAVPFPKLLHGGCLRDCALLKMCIVRLCIVIMTWKGSSTLKLMQVVGASVKQGFIALLLHQDYLQG